MEGNSEVARLLESIRLSYESAYFAMHGTAIVSQHEFITTRMENMQKAHAQLQTIVGEQEAAKLLADTLEHAETTERLPTRPLQAEEKNQAVDEDEISYDRTS
jgi:hypothetical protein